MNEIVYLTDEMIEQAAEVLWRRMSDVLEHRVFAFADAPKRLHYLVHAKHVLAATAPLIAAQAWEEGYAACRNRPRVDGYFINRTNPHQTRADAIERGES